MKIVIMNEDIEKFFKQTTICDLNINRYMNRISCKNFNDPNNLATICYQNGNCYCDYGTKLIACVVGDPIGHAYNMTDFHGNHIYIKIEKKDIVIII